MSRSSRVSGAPRAPGDEPAETPIESRPPMRADARRNRELILAAADAAFADEGLAVPVDEIARRAGVGAGTLYRHFPTKEALFEAVLVAHMDALAATGTRSWAAINRTRRSLTSWAAWRAKRHPSGT